MTTIVVRVVRLVRLVGKPRVHVLFQPGPDEDFTSVAPCGVKPSPLGGYFWMPAGEGAVLTCPKCRGCAKEIQRQLASRLPRVDTVSSADSS